MLVKDEADIIEATVRHLLGQGVAEVIVADNRSTDGTREILEGLPVELRDDPEIGYYQARKMTALARDALVRGHDWVIPCDADEIWGSAHGTLADVIARHDDHAYELLKAEIVDHVPTAADDAAVADPTARIGWRRRTDDEMTQSGYLPLQRRLVKVAVRLAPNLMIDMGNHSASYAGRATELRHPPVPALTIHHFPYRSPGQFIRKALNGARAYADANVSEQFGGHWRAYGRMIEQHGDQAGVDWYERWFYSDDPPRLPAGCREPSDEYGGRSEEQVHGPLFYGPAIVTR